MKIFNLDFSFYFDLAIATVPTIGLACFKLQWWRSICSIASSVYGSSVLVGSRYLNYMCTVAKPDLKY